MHKGILAALAIAVPTVAGAQEVTSLAPNTEVTVTLNDEVSSKKMRVGQTFDVSVSRDVMAGNTIVIPRGAKGVGEVTWRTGKGAFGKSAKMEIALRRIELGGRFVPVTGTYRQEGQGNTGATIGTIVAAGVIAGAFVTGKSAVFEQGRELRAHTVEALALNGAPLVVAPVQVAAVAVKPAVVAVPVVAAPAFVATPVVVAAPVAVAAKPAVAFVPVAMPLTTIVAASAVVAPAPVAAYAAPVVRHWPSRALPDQPTTAQRLQAVAPVKRYGKGWTISD